eukprot:PITA_33692
MELLCDLPSSSNDATSEEAIVDENLFLISSSDLWYGDIIIYLQTQTYRSNTSRSEQRRIRYQAKDYVIIIDTLYRHGIDTVLWRCLTLKEAEKVLNDCHLGACGGHQSGYATVQKILRAGYFWPTIFKDCVTAVRSCHACQIFDSKTRRTPTPLQPVVAVGPFAKWGIDFMTSNGQVEAINKVLKHMLQRMIGVQKRNWHLILYSALWAYRTSVRNATGFTPFQLVYGLEAILPVQCEIPSLKLAVDLLPRTSEEEARFLELIHLDETRRDVASANKAHKK